MGMPKTVTKISKKNGVTFTSDVDKIQYTIFELSRAALSDVGKFVVSETKKNITKRTGKLAKNTQKWVRANPKYQSKPDLQVGFKPGGFYGMYQEFGSANVPKVGALYKAVHENIPMIIKIESQYLSALEDEARALSLINESEVIGE